MTNISGCLKQKNNRWHCVIYWHDACGKRRFKQHSTGLPLAGNKRKAEAELKKLIREYEKQPQAMSTIGEMQFTAYMDLWRESIIGSVDPVTLDGYDTVIRRHLRPYFTDHPYKVAQVTQTVLQQYFNYKKVHGRADGKGGLKASSLKAHKVVLQEVLETASAALDTINPMSRVKVPRVEKYHANFYTVEQCNALFKAIKDEDLYSVVVVTTLLGLRRSELLGLKWSAVDFEKRTVTVCHTVVRTTEGRVLHKDGTKSKSSRRTYHMSEQLYELLKDLQAQQTKNRIFFGELYHENEYIFKWPDGHLYDPNYITRKFRQLLRKYDLPPIRFHDLRHSCASILYSLGMGVKEIQSWLGHGSAAITMDTYTHLFAEENEKTAAVIGAALFQETGKVVPIRNAAPVVQHG